MQSLNYGEKGRVEKKVKAAAEKKRDRLKGRAGGKDLREAECALGRIGARAVGEGRT